MLHSGRGGSSTGPFVCTLVCTGYEDSHGIHCRFEDLGTEVWAGALVLMCSCYLGCARNPKMSICKHLGDVQQQTLRTALHDSVRLRPLSQIQGPRIEQQRLRACGVGLDKVWRVLVWGRGCRAAVTKSGVWGSFVCRAAETHHQLLKSLANYLAEVLSSLHG